MTRGEESKVADIIKDLASHIERFKIENEMLRASRDGYVKQRDEVFRLYDEMRVSFLISRDRAEAAEAEVNRLKTELVFAKPVYSRRQIEDRVKVLEEALKPFAEEEPDHMDISEDNEVVTPHLDLVYGDFRRARTALASTGGELNGN